MPTSITTAPGLTKSRSIIRGRPTAAISTSARAHTARRSRVREWQTVTVALAASSSCAIGLPNRFERPTTTASAPSSSPRRSRSSSITPSGVHGRSPGRPSDEQTGVHRRQPVDVLLRRSISSVSDGPSSGAGTGSCSRIPLTSSFSASSCSRRATCSCAASARQTHVERPHPRLRARPLLAADVDRRRRIVADEHRRQARRAAGLRVERRTSSATSSRTRAAIALPSMIVAVTALDRTSRRRDVVPSGACAVSGVAHVRPRDRAACGRVCRWRMRQRRERACALPDRAACGPIAPVR